MYVQQAGEKCREAATECNCKQLGNPKQSDPCCNNRNRPACRSCRYLIGNYTGYIPKAVVNVATSQATSLLQYEDLELEDEERDVGDLPVQDAFHIFLEKALLFLADRLPEFGCGKCVPHKVPNKERLQKPCGDCWSRIHLRVHCTCKLQEQFKSMRMNKQKVSGFGKLLDEMKRRFMSALDNTKARGHKWWTMKFAKVTTRAAIPLPKQYWLCPPASKLRSAANDNCANQRTFKNYQAYVCLRDMRPHSTGGMGRFVLNKGCTQENLKGSEDCAMQPTLLVGRSSACIQVPFKDEKTLHCPPPGPSKQVFPFALRTLEKEQRVLRKKLLVRAYKDPNVCPNCKLRQSAKKCGSRVKLCSTCCRLKLPSFCMKPCERHKHAARSEAKRDARKCSGCSTHRPDVPKNHFAGACDYQMCRFCCEKESLRDCKVCSLHHLECSVESLEIKQPKRLQVGYHADHDNNLCLNPTNHEYVYTNPKTDERVQYTSVSAGLDTVFQTFEEFMFELLKKVPKGRRRILRATLKASGPMGTRVHAYLAKQLLHMGHGDQEMSTCTHPSFAPMINEIKTRMKTGWELFRIEASMVSLSRRFAGTPDVVLRKKTGHGLCTLYKYMIVDHKLSGSFSTSQKGPALFKKDNVLAEKASMLVARGFCTDVTMASKCVRQYYVGSLNETMFCHRIGQLVAYATLGTEGGYFPDMDCNYRVKLVVMVGHPTLAKKVRWMEVKEHPQGIVDLLFPEAGVELPEALTLLAAKQKAQLLLERDLGKKVLSSPRVPATQSCSRNVNSYQLLTPTCDEEEDEPCTQEYNDVDSDTAETEEMCEKKDQTEMCDADEDESTGAPQPSPKKKGLTGMRRESPKKLRARDKDQAAGAVSSMKDDEVEMKREERKTNARSKAASVLHAFPKEVEKEYTFHRVNNGACSLLFPNDDGKSGDKADISAQVEQLVNHASSPRHDDCRLVASVTNQDFLLALCVASLMKSNAPEDSDVASSPAVQVRRVDYVIMSNARNKKWRKLLRRKGRDAVERAAQAVNRENPPGKSKRQVWLRIMRPKGRSPVTPSGIMANDPGVRTCSTTLSTRGDSVSFLSAHGGDGKVLEDLAIQVDGLQSRMMMKKKHVDDGDDGQARSRGGNLAARTRRKQTRARVYNDGEQPEDDLDEQRRLTAVNSHKRRYRMRVAKLRVYKKAKDKIRDAHCKYVKFVTEHAVGYLDPRFGASQMAPCSRRASRKGMAKSSVRTMLSWCTYMLRMRMQQKAKRTENFLYVDCLEAYTSCTCSECGTVRPSFREEIFQCVNAECGLVVNRDQNAAKNIIIRSGFI